ncbi:hypothetical protein Tbd_0004 [Thiobacillus denitrificans ATCC 25259]|uniref:Uncharacterized protein n=1 Tax=Thiobacillus denitrificans (strain ATCC 25259 / T1) TaxID=292415 RepID=Q3SMT3_THIDA|nr:hypothetical protein Tbd_0004 [Thiobacillus denitrificans ATCC 25259]
MDFVQIRKVERPTTLVGLSFVAICFPPLLHLKSRSRITGATRLRSSASYIAERLISSQAQKSSGQASIQQLLSTVITPGARSLTPEPKGNEADPGVVVSLNFVRDRLPSRHSVVRLWTSGPA